MAKKKAPAADAEGGEAVAPKSKKKMIMIAAGVVLLLGAGGGGFFFTKSRGGSGPGEAAMADAHGGGHGGGDHGGGGHGAGERGEGGMKPVAVFLDVRDMVVNLSPEPGQPKGGFLKLRVALELKDSKVEQEVKVLLPRVEDAFQVYMRELRASDLAGSAGLYRLREELLRRVNIAIQPSKAEAVLFKDVVVQ